MTRRARWYPAVLLALTVAGCASSSSSGSAGPTREVFRPATGGSALFSPAVRVGDVLFLSGVIGRSASGDIGEATRQSMTSIQNQLQGLGSSMAQVVKCTVYMVDIAHYAGMNEVYTTFFPSEPPARTAIAVQALPGGAIVEVDCIAVAPTP